MSLSIRCCLFVGLLAYVPVCVVKPFYGSPVCSAHGNHHCFAIVMAADGSTRDVLDHGLVIYELETNLGDILIGCM